MLSPSLSQLLERARTRFGLEVEVLDAALRHVYPLSSTPLTKMVEESPAARQALQEALAGSGGEQLASAAGPYQVLRLRRATTKVKRSSALVAVRRLAPPSGAGQGPEAWPELARAIVEADVAASESLKDEREHARRLLATMRFLRQLVEIESETALGHAIVQAAAVWFDVDARIFERSPAGDFRLTRALPGVTVHANARTLGAHWVTPTGDILRVGSIPEWGELASGVEVALVPLSVHERPAWVLALVGSLPAEASSVFAVLGRVVGAQIERLRAATRDRTRARFEAIIESGGVTERLAVRLMQELAEATAAESASLVLHRDGRARRLVRVGSSDAVDTPAEGHAWRFTETAFDCRLPLRASAFAALELRSPCFPSDVELVAEVATSVIRNWLVGAEPSLMDVTRDVLPSLASAFDSRIAEELERARRFDLQLSLVLIGIPGPDAQGHEAAGRVRDAVRRELRGSDVLGTLPRDGFAALLTHTGDAGSRHVAARLRRRLQEASAQFDLTGVTLGRADFSPECPTAEAMLSQAAMDATPIGVGA